jgi:glycosyltransferase involved in cell wall biosynthesis
MTAISIVVPTRNRADVLGSSLASIASQRAGADFEVIVVDNASSDGTGELLRAWADRDDRFRSLWEERLGRSCAMNAGISVAQGSLLLFTDDDVELAPGWVESFRRFFESHGDLVIAGGAIEPAPPDLSAWPSWLSPASRAADGPGLDHGDDERALDAHEFLWGASMAVPARVFERLGTWNETVGRRGDHRGTFEDIDFQQRLRTAGGSVWYLPDARLRHRVPAVEVTPRRILMRAYRNGRNDAWFPPGGEPPSAVGAARGWAAFARWMAETIAFRARPDAGHFDRAREAARHAGRTGERVAIGRHRARAVVQRLAWACASTVLRLAPDRPSR